MEQTMKNQSQGKQEVRGIYGYLYVISNPQSLLSSQSS